MATHSYKVILQKAKIIKKSAEEKRKPAGGLWSYYIACSLLNPKTDIKKVSFKTAQNPIAGDKFNNVKMSKSDYLKMAKTLKLFVEKYKRLPNYIKWNGKKIGVRNYTYNLAKILVWYYAHDNKYPSYNNLNTGVWGQPQSAKLHSYLTDYGCSGMGQCTGYYCGCNSLQQCFYRLTGIHVSESTIANVAGTTYDGTDHDGLNTAVYWFNNKYNKNIKITWKNFSDLGSSDAERWNKLQSLIKEGAVFVHLLYRDKYGHYEVPKSVEGSYLNILNSLGDSCGNGTYCGYIEERSKSAQRSYMSGISQKSIAILTNG